MSSLKGPGKKGPSRVRGAKSSQKRQRRVGKGVAQGGYKGTRDRVQSLHRKASGVGYRGQETKSSQKGQWGGGGGPSRVQGAGGKVFTERPRRRKPKWYKGDKVFTEGP